MKNSPEIIDIQTVRVIPFSGFPLELNAEGASRQVFNFPEPGFFIGQENELIETAVRIASGEIVLKEQSETVPVIPPFPILFYGPSGTGKTHLSHGIHSLWKPQFPKRKIAFFSGPDFARALADSIETRTISDFRHRLRNLKRLLIDDIDELAKKPAAQEELLFAIEAIIDNGGHIVLTSRRSPTEKNPLENRLATRMWSGLPVPIAFPGREVRTKFFFWLASHHRIELSSELLEYLGKETEGSFLTIYGTFAKMLFEVNISGKPIKLDWLKRFLKERKNSDRPALDTIAKQTAAYFSIRLTDMKGKSRTSNTARARSVAIFIAREMTELSLKEIGRYFGNRDHTTISHLNDSTGKKIESDPKLRESVALIKERLQHRR